MNAKAGSQKRWMPEAVRWGCIALMAAVLMGCGYTMSSRPDGSTGPTQRIWIDPVENNLTPPRPGLEFDFLRRFKDEIALDRRFDLADDKLSDLRLRISLTGFREPVIVRDFENRQSEVNLVATVTVRMETANGMRQLQVSSQDSYAPGINEPREVGLDRLWRNLSRNVLDAVADRDWLADVE